MDNINLFTFTNCVCNKKHTRHGFNNYDFGMKKRTHAFINESIFYVKRN